MIEAAVPAGRSLVRELVGGVDGALSVVVASLENGRAVAERLDSGWLGVGEAVADIARTARRAKVLAVNASIEAAYVDGMQTGFGIVAERMRALAASTADAAADVHAIVTGTRASAVSVFGAIDDALASLAAVGRVLKAADDGGGDGDGVDFGVYTAAFERAVAEAGTMRLHGDSVRGGIVRMHDATGKAGAIVEAVAEIGAESQLLAINAAIEAARAGDRGRGFTVIADEIGRLAAETRRATDGIAETIEKLRVRGERLARASADGSAEMDVVVRKVVEGGDAVAARRRGYAAAPNAGDLARYDTAAVRA
jgi:methyl-accepting chemotaxis protein